MPLILEQTFLLGRFHATRWNQNPFEDRYGEWPPSPWRFLRALAARWFQYSRETGDENASIRDELLGKLAFHTPRFCLPESTWRGQPIRQYHPTEVAWTDASKKGAAYKKPRTTLVVDDYRAVPDTVPIFWFFDIADDEITGTDRRLLHDLARRTLYFGRAESHCRMRVVPSAPEGISINCSLNSRSGSGLVPVLVADPSVSLNIAVLLSSTDDSINSGRPIPTGTTWQYAELPRVPRRLPIRPAARSYPIDLRVLQFAVGGQVYPPIDRWIKIAERFRGSVLNNRASQILHSTGAAYRNLGPDQRDELALLSGKDSQGNALQGHRHAYFIVWPDERGEPTRLVCYRQTPFSPQEIGAMLGASERSYSWAHGNPDWSIRLVPLPFTTIPPVGFNSEASRVWISRTAFVPPTKRHRFRRNGRERSGESPDQILIKMLKGKGFPEPTLIEPVNSISSNRTFEDWSHIGEWVYIHETFVERRRRQSERARAIQLGYRFRIVFPEPVRGPICLGHSCHFGLGLFVPEEI